MTRELSGKNIPLQNHQPHDHRFKPPTLLIHTIHTEWLHALFRGCCCCTTKVHSEGVGG